MIHWPALRKGARLRVGQPSMDAIEVASSGPIIQGIGVRKASHNKAAPKASSKVKVTRKVRVEVMRGRP